jgi:hypothetical protein
MILLTGGCATGAAGLLLIPAAGLAVPTEQSVRGEGEPSADAKQRLAARRTAALGQATRDAIAAANEAPQDVRLTRRALAMARHYASTRTPRPTLAELQLDPLLAELPRLQPCPGLADVAATRVAFADNDGGGEAYLRAAQICSSVEAAVAAVEPLRAVHRCDEALTGLRETWPRVEGQPRDVWVPVLDAVVACSSDATVRGNLDIYPREIVNDYLAVLEARHNAELKRQHEADEEARRRFER